jgi:phenylpropionate dioxygenase-like ring-hydroxylating dioxygenase large terminal subunit
MTENQNNAKYGAYFQRDEPAPDEELTRVGPGTPCGEYLRRYWQPVAFSDELKDLPVKVTILAEELVLFRDKAGRAGLLNLHCSHRGVSLEFGLVSERGIRCCYHGWLFDVDGTILETPGEPATSKIKENFCHGAYPLHEFCGLIFAYMGPPDKRPVFPIYDTYDLPGYKLIPGTKHLFDCNWLQIRENSVDPVHTAFLHTIISGAQFTKQFGVIPQTEWQETPIGMLYTGARRVGEHVWVRVNDLIMPNIHQFPPPWEDASREKFFNRPMMTNWNVPIDDTHTMRIGFVRLNLSENFDEETVRYKAGFNHWERDNYEERQRVPWDYDAQVSQRPIAIHALEHLGTSDRGVVMYRRLLRAGIRANAAGEELPSSPSVEGPIPTYSQDTVVRLPKAGTPEDEQQLLLDTARTVASGFYRDRAVTASPERGY